VSLIVPFCDNAMLCYAMHCCAVLCCALLRYAAEDECRIVQQLDWQTAVWYERDKYPWPLTMRESLFCKRWDVFHRPNRNNPTADSAAHSRATGEGAEGVVVRIVDMALDLDSMPLSNDFVRAKAYVVHEMHAEDGNTGNTVWSMSMEFNVGGSIPTKLIGAILGETKKKTLRCFLFARRFSEAKGPIT
jgi:hypothetical protein